MRISEETIQKVNEVPITSILQKEGIDFKKIGREAVTVCPWHNDTHPSLTINNTKNFCFCFACRSHGDGISYVMRRFGLGFSDALYRIADNFSIPITDSTDANFEAKLKERQLIIDDLIRQQDDYRMQIKADKNEKARLLLADRGILPSTSKEFGLGYAESGFYRNRITIPIYNHRGNIVGFSGRGINNTVKPKYLNTVNNSVFDKSQIVFNEYRASDYIREADCVVFVEGYFDVISLWQHGIRNVVAMQGTGSPSPAVLNRITAKTKRFILCYDGDQGGRTAINTFISVARPMVVQGAISLSIAILPEGEDPDSVVQRDVRELEYIIESSQNWIDWQIGLWLLYADPGDTAKYMETESKIKALIDSITSPALRAHYIDKVAKLVAPDNNSAFTLASEWRKDLPRVVKANDWSKPDSRQIRAEAERKMLRLYIHFEELREELRYLLPKVKTPALKWLCDVIGDIETYDTLRPQTVLAALIVSDVHRLRQLRPLVMPTIALRKDDGILIRIKRVMADG